MEEPHRGMIDGHNIMSTGVRSSECRIVFADDVKSSYTATAGWHSITLALFDLTHMAILM